MFNRRPTVTVVYDQRPSFFRRAIFSMFAVFGLLCCGALTLPFLKDTFTGLADIFIALFITAVVLSLHALTARWCLSQRPPRYLWIMLHVPYLILYGMVWLWMFGKFMSPPSWWWIPWVGVTLLGGSWLVTWWVRGNIKDPKRAITFLAIFGLLVGGNVVGASVVSWRATEGFGFKGFPTTWQAWDATIAASCIGERSYFSSTGTKRADCPSGRRSGGYDGDLFRTATCNSDAVLKPFKRWLNLKEETGASGSWKWTEEDEQVNEKAAKLVSQMSTERFTAYPAAETVRLSSNKETWKVQLNKTVFGGWKVCAVEVVDPITVSRINPQQTPSPSPSMSTAPTPSPLPSWKTWDSRVSWWCSDDAGTLKRRDCPTPPADWVDPGELWICAPEYPFRLPQNTTWCRSQGWNVS